MHHERVLRGFLQPLCSQSVKVMIFARRGDELAAHPLGLEAQHHRDVRAVERRVEIVEHFRPHRLDTHGQQRRRRAKPHGGTERLQAEQVGTGNAAVQDIAADDDPEPGEIIRRLAPVAQGMTQRERVKQGLRRVFVLSVARIEHRAVDLVGDQLRRPARPVADDDRIGAHGIERDRGIDQRLALLHARLRGVHIDHIGAKALARNLEAQQRPRRVFEEGVDDGETRQHILVLGWLAVERHPLLRLVEQEEDFVPLQLADPDQVAVRESERTRRIAGRRGRSFRRCH